MRSSRVAYGITLALLLTNIAFGSTPQTFVTLISQPGDPVGQGITQTYTPDDGTFSVTNSTNTVWISFQTPSAGHFWSLQFGSPASKKFGRGEYEGAQRTAFRSPTKPGVDVSGDGRGCNTDTGRFLVSDFELNPDRTLARLAQSLTFSPGMTSQTVTVPLLNVGGSARTFYGKLSSPTGAPVWIGQASATF